MKALLKITLGTGKYGVLARIRNGVPEVVVNRLPRRFPVGTRVPLEMAGNEKLVLVCKDERAIDMWLLALLDARDYLRGEAGRWKIQ